METGKIEWTREEMTKNAHSGNNRAGEVWLATPKGAKYPRTMCIAADLVVELGWAENDTVWLYRNGSMFMIRKEPSDFVLKKQSPSSRTLILNSVDFVSHLNWTKNGTVFEAFVDEGALIMMPKRKEQ